MNTFYFNTGVRPETIHNPDFNYEYHAKLRPANIIKNGTLQIPFDCAAPQDAKVIFLCDIPTLPESQCPGVIVREVSNTTMISKYAYLRV